MPTYEFSCTDCANVHTEIRKIADRALDAVCPECGGVSEFKISTPMFTGGGNGWCGKLGTDGKDDVVALTPDMNIKRGKG